MTQPSRYRFKRDEYRKSGEIIEITAGDPKGIHSVRSIARVDTAADAEPILKRLRAAEALDEPKDAA